MNRTFHSLMVATMLMLVAVACSPAATTPVATSSASKFRVFVEPDEGTRPILDVLKSARKSIRMEMYLLTEHEIVDALRAARGRGVDVRVLLEANPVDSGTGNAPATNDLEASSVTVKESNPAYRLTHAKMIVVDNRIAVIMTLDQTHSGFTSNREFGVIDSDPADVAQVVAVFEADWKRVAPSVSNSNLVWSPTNARQPILALIDSAQQTLDIEAEAMQDREVEEHLISAVGRGVAVRVVMSLADSARDPNAAGQSKIKRGGVNLRMLKTPFVHANIFIADNARAFVGSQNISSASLDVNRELGILITDPQSLKTLSATFEADWNVGK